VEISLRSFRSPEMAVSLIVGAMRTLAEQDSRPAKTAIDFGQDDDITVLTVTRLAVEPAAMQFSDLSPAPA